jgi:Holliday junction resolvase RusA-like endonuclease
LDEVAVNRGREMTLNGKVEIPTCSKPRMTQRDRWAKRPCVVKYRKFCDELRAAIDVVGLDIAGLDLIFHIQMSKSWSKKKKVFMNGQPHRQVPDSDNLMKAFKDALLKDDSGVYDERARKFWTDGPSFIEFSIYEYNDII